MEQVIRAPSEQEQRLFGKADAPRVSREAKNLTDEARQRDQQTSIGRSVKNPPGSDGLTPRQRGKKLMEASDPEKLQLVPKPSAAGPKPQSPEVWEGKKAA